MGSFDIVGLLPIPSLPQYLETVDKELVNTIATDNPIMSGPILRLVKAPSKRLRSALLISIAASQRKKIDKKVICACVAVELLHIGSLVHDDLIDSAAFRRNRPTINSHEGPNSAIIIGDYLIAKACLEATKVSTEAVAKIASAVTKLCDGQLIELSNHYNTNRKKDNYFKAIKGKTAALFSVACELGGLCVGKTDSEVKYLANYGEEFGIVFQIIDDLLDFLSSEMLYGKPTGNDMKEGNYTIPLLIALNGQHSENLKAILKKRDKLSKTDVVNIILKDNSVKKTVSLIQKHSQLAVNNMGAFESEYSMKGLQEFPVAYWNWCLEHLVSNKYKQIVSTF